MFPHSSEYSKKTVSKDMLIDNLHSIGLSKGDHVIVTISYGKIGNVVGGPATVLDSLLEIIGPEGTLVMNTFSQASTPSRMKKEYVFDPTSSVSHTGFVTELLRIRADSVRSNHPTSSMAAIGKYSSYLTRDHNEFSRPRLPYYKMAKLGGKYLSIGLNDKLVAIRHTGQVLAGLYDFIPMYLSTQYRTKQGEVEVHYDYYPCSRNLHSIVPILEDRNVVKRGRLGMANSIIGNVREIIVEASRILSTNPELNLCTNPGCVWCREVERKLDLYGDIAESKYYQYPFLREITALVNKIRISKYRFVMYQDSWKSPELLLPLYLYIYSKLHKNDARVHANTRNKNQ
ncbi:MAG: AAC(3) family N-acetyltransferase [Promethearchaeota archaeon]